MLPSVSAEVWYESDPAPIDDDLEMSVLMARVGMATNALSTHLEAAFAARGRQPLGTRRPARDGRDLFVSLATAAAVLSEAIELAGKEMPLLRVLALEGAASDDLLKRVGKLRAGKHPASDLLVRSRNQLSFHWDAKVIAPSAREFAKNKKLIWLELAKDNRGVHMFALSVLVHALFPEIGAPGADRQAALNAKLNDMTDGVGVVYEFFTAGLFGYMKSYGVERKRRDDPAGQNPIGKGAIDETTSQRRLRKLCECSRRNWPEMLASVALQLQAARREGLAVQP